MTSLNVFTPKPIKRLDESVVNRISAGEVIHRPINVVKELLENCMDAKANRIEIILKDGGIKMIEIRDNGSGIRKEDLNIVCERFTTSKLQTLEDLQRIDSYGFRGEALAAISHISYVTIVSKTQSQVSGFKQKFLDGKPNGELVAVAANNGTIVTVDNLFYNVPTRKKALSSSSHEYNLIHDLITKYSLHYSTKVSFSLKKFSENFDINTVIDSSIKDNISRLFESIIANNLIEITFEDKENLKFSLKGFVTNQNVHKSSFVFILFINDRLVDCNPLKKAIDLVYSNVLMKSCHPFVYLSIHIDPTIIDVNIHPTKSEVRFLNEQLICEKIVEIIENRLTQRDSNSLVVNKNVSNLTFTPIAGPSKDSQTSSPNPSLNRSKSGSESAEKRQKQTTPVRQPHKQVRTDCKDRRIEEFLSRTKKNTKNRREIKYRSVLTLRETVLTESDGRLQDMICNSSYVGCVDQTFILIQFEQQLILTNSVHLNRELFYQLFLIDFGNFAKINFSMKPVITSVIEKYIEYLKSEEKTCVSIEEIENTLMENKDMISDYFAINISNDKKLLNLPLIIENHVPNMAFLGQFLYELATKVDWTREKECFQSIGRVLSKFYAKPPKDFKSEDEYKNWAKLMETTIYPIYKEILCPPKSLANNSTFFVTTKISDLYKVFERC